MSPAKLFLAASMARRQGVTADRALLAEGIVAERFFYHALATQLGVPFYEGQADVAPQGVMTIEEGYALLRQPIDGANWLFAPHGAAILRLMTMTRAGGDHAMFVITTPRLLTAAVRRAASPHAGRQAAFSAERIDGELSARASLHARWPLLGVTFFLFALLAALCAPVTEVARVSALILGMAFLASITLRLLACAASFSLPLPSESVANATLPVYTIVIALYRETRVVKQLARAINRFDYPVLCS